MMGTDIAPETSVIFYRTDEADIRDIFRHYFFSQPQVMFKCIYHKKVTQELGLNMKCVRKNTVNTGHLC
jgi:hypothetical protein